MIKSPEYDFLRTNEHLGKNIIYLTVSGSRAYGTNNENSDTDIRGVAIERPVEIYGNKTFEQVEDRNTDTVIYALKKYVYLCQGCNPNVIEMLGTREQDIIYINDIGRMLRDNVSLFLTKKAYATFAGYATMQLRRLQNALAHDSYNDEEKEHHILKSIQSMMMNAKNEYELEKGTIDFIIPDDENEIKVNVDMKKLSLRRFLALNSDLNNMLRNYSKLNHRNNKKDELHLRKHAMHLIRLYLTGIDILENEQIITYRENDLPMLRAIRSGDIPFNDVFKMADEYEAIMKKAYENSKLPEDVDVDKINNLLISIYRNNLS